MPCRSPGQNSSTSANVDKNLAEARRWGGLPLNVLDQDSTGQSLIATTAIPEKRKADKQIAKMKANNNGKMGGRNGGKPAIRPRARSLRPLAP
jgi:hypothetical protein